jgi:hypothetical protein
MGEAQPVFRRHRLTIWRELEQHLTGAGDEWDGTPLRVRSGPFVVTLDVHAALAGYATNLVTRLRATYVNRDGFRFGLQRRSWATDISGFLGLQDIEIGDEAFDREFVVKANDADQVRRLLVDADLRRAILDSGDLQRLEVRDDEGWFGPEFPEGVDELYLEAGGRLRDPLVIEQLFAVFADVLTRLCHIGSAYERDPELEL